MQSRQSPAQHDPQSCGYVISLTCADQTKALLSTHCRHSSAALLLPHGRDPSCKSSTRKHQRGSLPESIAKALLCTGATSPCRGVWALGCPRPSQAPAHLLVEGAVADAAHDGAAAPHDGHGAVAAVKHQARNVLARHVGQLPREDVLQRHQPVEVRLVKCRTSTGVRIWLDTPTPGPPGVRFWGRGRNAWRGHKLSEQNMLNFACCTRKRSGPVASGGWYAPDAVVGVAVVEHVLEGQGAVLLLGAQEHLPLAVGAAAGTPLQRISTTMSSSAAVSATVTSRVAKQAAGVLEMSDSRGST
jgi:hypothetical protein